MTDRHSILALRTRPAVEISKFKKSKMANGCQLERATSVVLMDIINSLLKTGIKAANINVKKLQFIHTVNGDGSKTAKIIKRQC